uniref:Disks large-associated protein 5 n=1 Tax=Callorhinchus milii TaxID=7868 RepID=A0A4W3HZF4_CALMI
MSPLSPSQEQESSKAKTSVDSRREMLRRYKEDKLLRQLKAQRENPKPVFRAGVYRPDAAQYLELRTVPQTTEQSKPKTFLPSSLRVTRSMSKKLESMLPNETRHAVSTKVDSVVAHVKSNQGGYTRGLAVTQAQCQLPPPAAGAKERKAPHAAPLKPPQTRGRTEPKPALKVAGPVPAASINPPQTRGRTGLKPILKSAASVQVSEPRISVGKTLKQAEKEEKHYRKQAAHILPAQPEPEILPEPDSAEEMAGGAEEMALQAGDGRQILSSATVLAPGEVDKKVSFAPENYAFRPMTGLAPFIFTPLSPRQAASFGTSSWGPIGHKHSRGNRICSPTVCTTVESKSALEINCDTKGEEPAAIVDDVEAPVCRKPQESLAASLSIDVKGSIHDVPYFRGVMRSETEKLTALCQQWESQAELPEVADSGKDLIRTTVGQARLLMAQRFKQFQGLIDDCQMERGQKEVTCTDLDGFWDMIYFQVEDVSKKFDLLKTLQENGWQEQRDVPSLPKRVVKKKIALGKSSAGKSDKSEHMARKSRLAEVKAAMKAKLKLGVDSSEVERNLKEEMVVFDAGFFRVESPAKVFPTTPAAPDALRSLSDAGHAFHGAAAVNCMSPFASLLTGSEQSKLPLQAQDLMSFSPSLSPQ